MNKFFYPKLAINNIKKNYRTYIPYFLTCIGTIMMFYNISYLSVAEDIGSVSDSGSVRQILFLGAIVIGIFSLIFLFYTNSFLIKRRKKEFGLFNILGMEKKHIAKIMFYETAIIAIVTILVGILLGVLLSKLMLLMLFNIMLTEAPFGFEVPLKAILATIGLFCAIFIVNLIYNMMQVHLSKPVELLEGGNVGEKEPNTKWLITITGFVSLGLGYYIAIATKSPLAALNKFFVAVILVIIGTYCLFTSGSIAVLKMLRSNKKYYYQTRNFISISGMIYRMKQNAAGLANICILSTAVIIMISSTISLYSGIEDVLRTMYPRNIIVSAVDISDKQAEQIDALIEKQISESYIDVSNVSRYRFMGLVASQDGSSFNTANYAFYSQDNDDFASLIFITQDEYNKLEDKSVSLNSGESIVYTSSGKIPGNTINLNGYELIIKENLTSLKSSFILSDTLINSYCVVVNNVSTIEQVYKALNNEENTMEKLSYFYGFDVEADEKVQTNIVYNLHNVISELNSSIRVEGAEVSRDGLYAMYGGLFFLGIFLGLLFIMATVLIIYYKQIAEGYDDKERFEIMQKVGMSKEEVKHAIKSQVLTVFFLPLITTVIHIAFAFKVIVKLLAVLNLTNVPLFALCTFITIIIFTLFYTIIYAMTARSYYKIVSY